MSELGIKLQDIVKNNILRQPKSASRKQWRRHRLRLYNYLELFPGLQPWIREEQEETMPNIFDYLEWRGDVPFDVDPFNDVDNLILSELAYTVFDGSVPDSGVKVPLGKVRNSFLRTHERSLLEKSDRHLDRAPLLMDGMMSGKRFSRTRLSDYISSVDADKTLQIAALTFTLSDGSLYIAFRGTDSTIVGWKEDFIMSYRPETEGQRRAIEYLNRIGSKTRRPIRVGGHSKGGNFAVYASAFADPKVKKRIIQVYTNDGPGFRHEVLKSKEYKETIPLIKSIVPDTSIIGMLLTNRIVPKVVRSNEKGLFQHDALSWEVLRNDFVSAELSELGKFIRETQVEWLEKIDDIQRETFVDTLFSRFGATGMGTFGAMNESRLKTIEKIIASTQELSRERQKQLVKIAAGLIYSGGQNMKIWYSRILEDCNEQDN